MNEQASTNILNKAIALPRRLDLRAATPLASEFMSARGDQIVVDASNVEMIGAQCIQVILSAAMTWERDGLSFLLARPSAAFVDATKIAGVSIDRFMEQELSK